MLHTDRLAAAVIVDGSGGVVATVPAGERWIIRDTRVTFFDDATDLWIGVYDGTDYFTIWSVRGSHPAWVTLVQFDSFAVVLPGEEIQVYPTGADCDVVLSGTRLTIS